MTRPVTSSQWTQEHYEAIRLWSLTRPRPNNSPNGAALLLRRGMTAWLQTGSAEALPSKFQAQAANEESLNSSIQLNAHAQGEREVSLTLVLATMVEQAQMQMEVVR